MHLVYLHNLAMRPRRAIAEGRGRRVQAFTDSLEVLVAEDVVLAAAISEPGQDVTHPRTRAITHRPRLAVDGRKVFCTMSPAATESLRRGGVRRRRGTRPLRLRPRARGSAAG